MLNSDIVYEFSIPQRDIDRVAAIEGEELARREQAYRDGLAPVPLRARNIVLVDDGLATGASMRAAIVGVRAHSPASVTVASVSVAWVSVALVSLSQPLVPTE